MRIDDLYAFISERYAITMAKAIGAPKPWTKDPILQSYRFCNVHREDDTVTRWIRQNWGRPHSDDPDLWFAFVIARLINWPDTLAEMGYPLPRWRPKKFWEVVHGIQSRGAKAYSGAYIVSTNGNAMEKAEYLATRVLGPLYINRAEVRPVAGDSLEEFHSRLLQFDGMGSFMAAQVVADTKFHGVLSRAPDWWRWAASGPGSRRGLNRVLERPTNAPWKEAYWRHENLILLNEIMSRVQHTAMTPISAQDLQNCLCEFDKYERTRLGEGRPRSRYSGRE